ncbi:zinc knuckle CX2CX4HX4C containing protein [Tanacetum coccineum]
MQPGILKKAMRTIASNMHDVVIPLNDGSQANPQAAAKVMRRYENSIVGKDPSFPVVQQYVSNTWRKFGFEKITRNDEGVYLFKFASKSGMDQVLEKGPWLIHKSPIILNKWTACVSLKKGEVTKVPVWVKLYNVPVLAYSEDGLSLIATQIGKPIMLDAFTSSMCVESWGRISFARALIEISASFVLKKEWKGDDIGDSGKQSKGIEQVNSDFNVNNKKDREPSSSKLACNDVHKDKNVSSYPELKKWDCINESDTNDDDVIPSYGSFLGGGN